MWMNARLQCHASWENGKKGSGWWIYSPKKELDNFPFVLLCSFFTCWGALKCDMQYRHNSGVVLIYILRVKYRTTSLESQNSTWPQVRLFCTKMSYDNCLVKSENECLLVCRLTRKKVQKFCFWPCDKGICWCSIFLITNTPFILLAGIF